jgi:predicted O-methyltransferase YrrM
LPQSNIDWGILFVEFYTFSFFAQKCAEMNFALKKLTKYCEKHTSLPTEVLYELERETNLKTLAPQMLSGHLQGALLTMLSKMQQPKTILEIGTFTGYAAICMAQGLTEDGVLHTIEANEELGHIIQKYIEKAGLKGKIISHMGKAEEVIPTVDLNYDMAFIDAGKRFYELHFNMIIDRMNPGGLIIADNILWSGKVTLKEHDKDTSIIHSFNEKIHNDPRIENVMLPIRDGLLLMRKK